MNSPAGPRDENAAMTSPWPSALVPAVKLPVAAGLAAMKARNGRAVGQMDGGQPVVVGLDVGQGRVVEDHPYRAALQDVEALLHPGVHAALAGDDLARRTARPGPGRRTAGRLYGRGRRQHDRRGTGAGGDRCAVRRWPWRRRLPVTVSVDWNSRVWVEAATAVVHGDRWLAVLAPGPSLPAEVETNTPAA